MTRQKIGFFLGPTLFIICLFMPLPEGMSPEALKTAAVTLLIAVWWITEAVPIPATSLLPIALLPILGVMDSAKVTLPYADPIIFLFLGGFLIAIGIEKWNLHKRIAFYIIAIVGTKPDRIILGFMITTFMISMWISNSSTAIMMLPIALGIINEIVEIIEKNNIPGINTTPTQFMFGVNMMLGLAYAASIGGISTIVGTPPNMIMVGLVEKIYNQHINFASWMVLALPLSVILLFAAWFYLVKFGFPIGFKELPGGKSWFAGELKKLGPVSKPEKYILFVFLFTAVSWIVRGFITIDAIKMIKDPTIAMIGGILLFVIPVDFKKGVFLLDWQSALKVPWGIIILFGGGLSLAAAMQSTGLDRWIGAQIMILQGSNIIIVVLGVVLLSMALSNLMSNTAAATLLIPIMGVTAVAMSIHPYILIIASIYAISHVFILPTGTPPNAVAFGSGYVTMSQMVRAGLVLSIIGIFLITIFVPVFLPLLWGFDPGSLPDWVKTFK